MSISARSVNLFSLSQDPAALKEEGNTLFKAGDMQGAVCCYTKALKLCDGQDESAVLHRNRSACYLKLEEYSKAEADASIGGVTQSTIHKKLFHSKIFSQGYPKIHTPPVHKYTYVT